MKIAKMQCTPDSLSFLINYRCPVTVPVLLFNSLSLLPITDVNECGSAGTNECDSKAQCTNIEGSYNCRCLNGYQGDGKNCSGTGFLYSTFLFSCYFVFMWWNCKRYYGNGNRPYQRCGKDISTGRVHLVSNLGYLADFHVNIHACMSTVNEYYGNSWDLPFLPPE